MKFWLVSILLLFSTSALWAQQHPEGQEQIRAAKITWITNRLNLTPEQSKTFWPLYNEKESRRRQIRHKLRQLNGETNNLTSNEEAIRRNLKEFLDLRQQEVDLEKEYQGKFLRVIDPKQLAELYKADQRFTQMLIERLNNKPSKERRN
ncbi:MAG: Spy/CpxP family protein refolding chaperone [Siphonobacter sp.]